MKTYIAALFSFLVLVSYGCKLQPELKNETNIIIPEEFEIIKHDKESGYILAVKYKDEMQIIVSENMSNTIKKSAMFGPGLMKQNFEITFPVLMERTNGFNESEQDHYFVNGNIYLHRSFEYDIDNSNGYYEYGALYIKEPEEYFEFFITGSQSLKESHQPLIKSFLEGVK